MRRSSSKGASERPGRPPRRRPSESGLRTLARRRARPRPISRPARPRHHRCRGPLGSPTRPPQIAPERRRRRGASGLPGPRRRREVPVPESGADRSRRCSHGAQVGGRQSHLAGLPALDHERRRRSRKGRHERNRPSGARQPGRWHITRDEFLLRDFLLRPGVDRAVAGRPNQALESDILLRPQILGALLDV